jgi:hypothetical protein
MPYHLIEQTAADGDRAAQLQAGPSFHIIRMKINEPHRSSNLGS